MKAKDKPHTHITQRFFATKLKINCIAKTNTHTPNGKIELMLICKFFSSPNIFEIYILTPMNSFDFCTKNFTKDLRMTLIPEPRHSKEVTSVLGYMTRKEFNEWKLLWMKTRFGLRQRWETIEKRNYSNSLYESEMVAGWMGGKEM